MIFLPIPLFFASGRSATATAQTDEGKLVVKRNLSQVESIRTEGSVSVRLTGDENYQVSAAHKSGDRYEGSWQSFEGTKPLPQDIACQAYESVRTSTRLEGEQVDDMLDLVTDPLNFKVTAETCRGRK